MNDVRKFSKFLKHFVFHVWSTHEKKVLLILDNHQSHISLDAIDYARENGVVLLSFPPHCSHKLQPLDRTVYGPFKRYYNNACNGWMTDHPGSIMTIYKELGHEYSKDLENDEFLQRLAYLSDIFEAFNIMNLSLQGRNGAIVDFVSKLGAFIRKLDLWKRNTKKQSTWDVQMFVIFF